MIINSTGDIDWSKTSTSTGTGKLIPYKPYGATFTFPEPAVIEPTEITPPKCYECGKEVEGVSTFVKKSTFVIILKCHGDERRVDISLRRFKGSQDDAIEWFSDNFQWVFAEEEKWRKVRPDRTVATVHADRKIISDWLDNI